MADEKKEDGGGPIELFWMVAAALGVLIFLWFASGAYKNADLGGLFISPPPPVGPGNSYGPQIGEPNPNYQVNE